MNGGKVQKNSCECQLTQDSVQSDLSVQRLVSCDLSSFCFLWVSDMSSTFRQLPGCPDHPDTPTPGYDIVILSDLLHFHTSHGALIASLTSLMAKSPASRAYIAAGNYTSPHVCDNFLREGNRAGLTFEEGISPICANDGTNAEITDIDKWLGKMPVSGLDEQQLSMRKAMCRWWVGRWADDFCSGFLKV